MFLELLILHLAAAGISLFGGLMMWRHRAIWAKQQIDPQIEAGERKFLDGQYRRRTQSSAMLVALGILLHASNEHLVNWQKAPAGFFIYICIMLVLVVWVVLLAMADYMASRIVHQSALSRLREQQRQLEESVLEMRRKQNR